MSRSISLSKTQQYLDWLKTKLFLDSNAESAKKRVVKRGEVYKCNLGIGIGSEESKERPCVVLQRDKANLESPNSKLGGEKACPLAKVPGTARILSKTDGHGNQRFLS